MSDKYKDIKAGKPVKYTHEEYMITDSKGVHCRIRCSFDKERFFLRAAQIVEKLEPGITHSVSIPELILSDYGEEYVSHRKEAGDY